MPKATLCLLNNKQIGIEEALRLKEESKRTGRLQPNFNCVTCHKSVRPHRDGGKIAAHFEHLERNADCPLSDPLRT